MHSAGLIPPVDTAIGTAVGNRCLTPMAPSQGVITLESVLPQSLLQRNEDEQGTSDLITSLYSLAQCLMASGNWLYGD